MLRWEDVTKREEIKEAFRGISTEGLSGNQLLQYVSIESARIVASILGSRHKSTYKKFGHQRLTSE
jgi:hypothetical protein